MQEGAAMRSSGHCSTNGLVNEPAEGWQGVPLGCLLAPDNKTHLFLRTEQCQARLHTV